MKEFIVKTNFGHTYRWSSERIAEDYASTAIQWQHEDDITHPKTSEQLYAEILGDEEFLTQWFNDYIRSDIAYAVEQAELIKIDIIKYDSFMDWAFKSHGYEE